MDGGCGQMSVCRSCGAQVLWAYTIQGNAMPLDVTPTAAGNVLLTGRKVATKAGAFAPECRVESGSAMFDDGTDRYMPHHATCPQADEWRRR